MHISEIKKYLLAYPKTESKVMDHIFLMTEKDVYELSVKYRIGSVGFMNQEDTLEELSDLRSGMMDGLPLTRQTDSFIEQLRERPNAIVVSGMEMCDYFVVGEWLWI